MSRTGVSKSGRGSLLRSSGRGAVRLTLDEGQTRRTVARAFELTPCLPGRPPIGAGGPHGSFVAAVRLFMNVAAHPLVQGWRDDGPTTHASI
jgi:hypothetical protein